MLQTTNQISFRIDEDQLKLIDKMIYNHQYENRTEIIKKALNLFFSTQTTGNGHIDIPMTKEEEDYWKKTIQILEIDKTYIAGRYRLYCNTFEEITFDKWKIIYEQNKQKLEK